MRKHPTGHGKETIQHILVTSRKYERQEMIIQTLKTGQVEASVKTLLE